MYPVITSASYICLIPIDILTVYDLRKRPYTDHFMQCDDSGQGQKVKFRNGDPQLPIFSWMNFENDEE